MNNREKAGIELAALVISANQICDRSKLDDIELVRLNRMVKAARGILVDTAEYDKNDDSKAFV